MTSFGQAGALAGPMPTSRPRRRASSETLVGEPADPRASSVTLPDVDSRVEPAVESPRPPVVTFGDEDADDVWGDAGRGGDSFAFEIIDSASGSGAGDVSDSEGEDQSFVLAHVHDRATSTQAKLIDRTAARADGAARPGPSVAGRIVSQTWLSDDGNGGLGGDDDEDAFEIVARGDAQPPAPVRIDEDDQFFQGDAPLELDDDAFTIVDEPVPVARRRAPSSPPVAGPSQPGKRAPRVSPSVSPEPIAGSAEGKGKAAARPFATARPPVRAAAVKTPLTAEQAQLKACLVKANAARKQLNIAEAKKCYRKALDYGLSQSKHDELVAKLPAIGSGGAIKVDLPAAKPRRRDSSSPRRPTWHASAAAPSLGKKRAPAKRR